MGAGWRLFRFGRSTAVELIDAATKYTAIEESMLFKEKKFQKNDIPCK